MCSGRGGRQAARGAVWLITKEEEDCVSFVQRGADCRKQHITNIIVCYKDIDNPLLNITFN